MILIFATNKSVKILIIMYLGSSEMEKVLQWINFLSEFLKEKHNVTDLVVGIISHKITMQHYSKYFTMHELQYLIQNHSFFIN